mmetsp:Transcript_139251/g.338258  ORF Transcript_139251/g.338258 Transcript_139251/m.338258 type:complete len:368 (+) Transcript_139251:6-1109(+)
MGANFNSCPILATTPMRGTVQTRNHHAAKPKCHASVLGLLRFPLQLLAAAAGTAVIPRHVGQFLGALAPVEEVVQGDAAGVQRALDPARRAVLAGRGAGSGEKVLQELAHPLRERASPDGLPHLSQQVEHEVQVVQRDQGGCHRLLSDDGVQHGPAIILERAFANFQGPEVVGKLAAGEPELARAHERRAEARGPARVDTIEHVHAQGHANYDVQGIPHAHEVSRLVGWQAAAGPRALLHYAPELVLLLTAAEATDGVAREVAGNHLFQRELTELRIQVPLDYAKEVLAVRPLVRLDATVSPPQRPVRGLQYPVLVRGGGRDHVIQRHHDVGANGILGLYGLLRRQQHAAPCFLGVLKLNALLLDHG